MKGKIISISNFAPSKKQMEKEYPPLNQKTAATQAIKTTFDLSSETSPFF